MIIKKKESKALCLRLYLLSKIQSIRIRISNRYFAQEIPGYWKLHRWHFEV